MGALISDPSPSHVSVDTRHKETSGEGGIRVRVNWAKQTETELLLELNHHMVTGTVWLGYSPAPCTRTDACFLAVATNSWLTCRHFE